jgi:hypothetical protein
MPDVLTPLLSFLSTASVALLAGMLSYAAGKGMKRHEWDLNLRREKVELRQRLYAEFLAEANRLILQSIQKKSGELTAFYKISEKFSEIELISAEPVSSAAKSIFDKAVSSNVIEEKEGTNFFDLKRNFIQQVRIEIAGYEK